ncbi:MAG: hypothetical protein FWG59_06575 [Betaproteobacteria bacterium]|nr:hypothetical protein [Betaproteobacteria bacterium]
MSTTPITHGTAEHNALMAGHSTPDQSTWATINYVTKDGIHINGLAELEGALEDVAWLLEERLDVTKGKTRETLREATEAVRELLPDLEAMQPEPNPIAEAQAFLREECQRAQELLKAETDRMRKEAFIKEAYFMPAEVLNGILDIAIPGEDRDPQQWRELHERIKAFLEEQGWKVNSGFGIANPAYIRSREPLRQLARLIDGFPLSSLTSHALAVIHYALRWCENTSHKFTSPITGKGQCGIPPEGVLYPHISMELVKVESFRDVPKEWQMPLVPEQGKE